MTGNPGSILAVSRVTSNLLSTLESNVRVNTTFRGFNRSLDDLAPSGFARGLFPDTADDEIINAIINEQFNPARTQVQFARDRGNLNDVGFESALEGLEASREAAGARLQDIGGGILTGFRGQLRDVADRGFSRANAFELGGSFDPTSIGKDINTLSSDLSGRLGGAVRNAVGGEQFFNLENLITRGGIAQGAQNPRSGLLDMFATRERERSAKRGLGEEGVF